MGGFACLIKQNLICLCGNLIKSSLTHKHNHLLLIAGQIYRQRQQLLKLEHKFGARGEINMFHLAVVYQQTKPKSRYSV